MPQRPSSSVIDLTSSQIDFTAQPEPSHSNASMEQRGVKRRRVDFPSYSAGPSSSSFDNFSARRPLAEAADDYVEAVDLTEINDDNALAKVLAKQREDAIKAQAATEDREGRTTLTATKCAICMDTPTDATTTVCGHMFCHKCIIDSLRYEEERSEVTTGKAIRGNALRVESSCREKILQAQDAISSLYNSK